VQVAGKRITKHGFALLAIVLIGLFLRLYHLGTQSIWFDEAVSVWASKLAVQQMVQATAADVHPPLYYFLLHYWVMIFGTSEFAVRLLSVLFGVLAIPMTYMVGRQLFNEEAGLLGALILAVSAFNVQYSQEARMYSLMVLLALLSAYFFIRLSRQSTLALSAGYVLSTTLLVYTHFYGFFVVIAQNIYVVTLLVLSKHRPYRLRHWVALQAIVFALFAPWGAVLINQISRREAQVSLVQPPTIATIIDSFVSYAGGRLALLVLFLGLSVLSLFVYQKVHGAMDWKAPLKALESYSWEVRIQDAAPVYFLVVWLITINLIPFIISRYSAPIYVLRYTITASVALYLLVARGISNINHKYTKLAVIGVIVLLSVPNLNANYSSISKPQAREATSLIDANAKSGDVVLVYLEWPPVTFDYYNNRTDLVVKQIHSLKELQFDVTGHDRVWVLDASWVAGKATENFTPDILNESYARTYAKSCYGYEVYLYEKRA
jgi:uncharacterized membrane protein